MRTKSAHQAPDVRTAARLPWTVRPSREGDEAELARLFETVFGQFLTAEQWRWKLCSQAGSTANSWLAATSDCIVGHYGGMPLRYRLGDRETVIMHGCNAMTHPDFRRQGVLTAVHSRANEAWQKAGIPFQTGLHYGGWGTRREFLGWRPLFTLVWVNCPLRPFSRALQVRMGPERPFRQLFEAAAWTARGGDRLCRALWMGWLQLTARSRRAKRTEIYEVGEAGPDFDTIWEHGRSGYETIAVRDRAFVAWRFIEAPGYHYRLLVAERDGLPLGYLVYRLTTGVRPTGWIADLFAPRDESRVRHALLQHALTDLYAAGAETAVALVPAGSFLHREMRRAGFLMDRGTYDFSIVPLDPALNVKRLRDPSRWYLTGADFDVV